MNCVYQLDLFHIYNKASKKVKDEKARKELYKRIKESQWEELISLSRKLWEQAPEEEKENLKELYNYYNNHREALKRYWEVIPKEILEKVPHGEIRGMGTMESSIHNVLADRMKGVAWSKDGADTVAKSLSLLHSEDGDLKLGRIIYSKEPGFMANSYIAKVLRKRMNENKREVSRAVRDIMRENNRKRKYGGVNSHVEVFNGKVTRLTTALKDLVHASS